MITVAQAKAKIKQIDASTSPAVIQLFCDVLDRKRNPLSQQESFKDPLSREWVGWIENRLAQPHLGYLPADQSNGVWGGSTTEALAKLAKNYSIAYDTKTPILGSDLMRALLDGSKVSETPVTAEKNSYDWFKAAFAKNHYDFDERPMHFNVLGVRGYLLPSGEVPDIGDRYNDTIFLIWIDNKGNKRCESFIASCDPGAYYYATHVLNPSGCAHLVEGQYNYQRGLHGASQYPAFVQAGPVKVARTFRASFDDRSKTETGYFGINIHSGYAWAPTDAVGNSSAGCQVLMSEGPKGENWLRFYNLLNQHAESTFKYSLLKASQLR